MIIGGLIFKLSDNGNQYGNISSLIKKTQGSGVIVKVKDDNAKT